MNWNYKGPQYNTRDQVRFLVGDVCESDPLVSDEEILWAISRQPTLELAAALVLRALAARFSRKASSSVGGVSNSCSDIARAFKDRADELDPQGATVGHLAALPRFGGVSRAAKDTLDQDSDAVPPAFRKAMDDIPGGPSDADAGSES